MRENKFQRELIKELRTTFAGCIVLKNDPNYIQGIPDLTILHKGKWAALEVKQSAKASHRPNQDYYIDKMNSMSYANFIFPENKKEVMDDLGRLFSDS